VLQFSLAPEELLTYGSFESADGFEFQLIRYQAAQGKGSLQPLTVSHFSLISLVIFSFSELILEICKGSLPSGLIKSSTVGFSELVSAVADNLRVVCRVARRRRHKAYLNAWSIPDLVVTHYLDWSELIEPLLKFMAIIAKYRSVPFFRIPTALHRCATRLISCIASAFTNLVEVFLFLTRYDWFLLNSFLIFVSFFRCFERIGLMFRLLITYVSIIFILVFPWGTFIFDF
jgi:hypothetical protein